MLTRSLMALVLLSEPAWAQDASLRYATFADCPTALAISSAAWAAVRCDPQPACDKAQVTRYVFQVQGLTDGTKCVVVVKLGDVYVGEHIRLANGKTYDLTAGQIAALSTRAGMGAQLGDVLPVALVGSRLSALGKTAAVNAAVNADPTLKTDYQTLTGGPIDLQGALVGSVMARLVTAKALTDADVKTLTAPNAVSTVTQ